MTETPPREEMMIVWGLLFLGSASFWLALLAAR
jgi:hypothetical protein